MAKTSDYNNKLQSFANRVKTEPVQLPVQKITPIHNVIERDEQQLNVWISKDLMKKLKVKGAETGKSLKEMVTEAIINFL